MSLKNCPKCEKILPPPFKSSGRQVCSKCGWSSKSISGFVPESVEQTDTDSQIDFKEKISTLISSFTKQQIIIASCLAITSIIGMGGKLAWANGKVYCVNEDEKVAADVIKSHLAKWDDRIELAHSTSRINLPPVIRELQDIKREVESEKWGECAKPGVDSLVSSMNYEIEGFIKFLDSDTPDSIIQGKMENAALKMEEFKEIYPTLQFKQTRKFWDIHLTEQEAKELLSTLWGQQFLVYSEKQTYETDLKNLKTEDGDLAEYARKNLKDYKIDISLDEKRLTTKLLSKNKKLKSFVQILEPEELEYADLTLTRYLICQSSEPSKQIESPKFSEDPECPNGTLLVSENW